MYAPPYNSTHANDDLSDIEAEVSKLSNFGEIALIGDFNARIGASPDYVIEESSETKIFQDILPTDYVNDKFLPRNSLDNIINNQGQNLLNLCMSSRLRILNGRYLGDLLGYNTCFTVNGCSTVDYAVLSESLLSSVKCFCTCDLSYLSDHVPIYFVIKCNVYCNQSFVQKNKTTSLRPFDSPNYKWTEQSKFKLYEVLNSEDKK